MSGKLTRSLESAAAPQRLNPVQLSFLPIPRIPEGNHHVVPKVARSCDGLLLLPYPLADSETHEWSL